MHLKKKKPLKKNLLQSLVEPHKPTAMGHLGAVHLKFQLVERAVSVSIHLFLEIDPVGTLHLVEDLFVFLLEVYGDASSR